MGGKSFVSTAALIAGAFVGTPLAASEGGGLRRKRSAPASPQPYQSTPSLATLPRDLPPAADRRRLAAPAPGRDGVGEDLARRFFLPPAQPRLDEIDLRQLILEMNLDGGSMSMETPKPTRKPTKQPTATPTYSTSAPSVSHAPTLTDCSNPGTCYNRLQEQIYAVSVRVGSDPAVLLDPCSAQARAANWILEECDAVNPIDPCSQSQLILNEQRYALAVMYFSLGGEDWNIGSNPGVDEGAPPGAWLSGRNYCEWGAEIAGTNGAADAYNQLQCDEYGNVLNLNLQSNNLAGELPPEIGALVYLTSYISFFNAQTGPIPTALGLIAPLRTFDVESNDMDGNLFQPEYAGPDGLTEIESFRASLNNFDGNIPSSIGRWTKLQNLWFADNEITGTIPREIGNLRDLGAFLVYKNNIAGTIPPDIGNLDLLTWIDMEDNDLVGTIPEEFYTNLDLKEVIFKNNSLSGTISDRIGDLAMLGNFWGSHNQLSGTIPTEFGLCLNLKELELQDNNLVGPIPYEFGDMESVEFLSLESNMLTGTIPPSLFGINLIGLRILYLNDNQLSGPVPDTYGGSPRMKDLWINDNQLTGTLPIIAEGEFLFLEELLLNNNDLTGVIDDSLCLIRNDTQQGGGNLGVFHSDCQPPPDGGAPQIICNCCTACFV